MEGWEPATYGDRWAATYDDWVGAVRGETTDATVVFLADLAGAGPVLELAIGTGRVALPLAERGLEVHGIDASAAMLERLRAKPGGERIAVTIGDFADVDVDGTYPLVYLVFNTLFALDSQDEQVRCFANVAAHLDPGGVFVIDAFVPDLSRFTHGQTVRAQTVELDQLALEASVHDPVGQRVASQHVVVTAEGVRMLPVQVRYAWPSELDLMARLAGLGLRERWGSWQRDRFGPASAGHVSVYERG